MRIISFLISLDFTFLKTTKIFMYYEKDINPNQMSKPMF